MFDLSLIIDGMKEMIGTLKISLSVRAWDGLRV